MGGEGEKGRRETRFSPSWQSFAVFQRRSYCLSYRRPRKVEPRQSHTSWDEHSLVMETTTAAPRHSHQQLRRAFIEQARKYIGVPYSKSACRPEHKDATFYLDCCGLVRQVLRDLEPMFGFTIGQGNQAYQYDTLPVALNSTEEMLPGD